MAEASLVKRSSRGSASAGSGRHAADEWRTVRLRDVILKTEQSDPWRNPSAEFEYVDVSCVSRGSLRIESSTRYQGAKAPSRARKKIRSGDVLFATVRPSLRRVALVPPSLDGQICSTAFCVIRADPEQSDEGFLFFAVASDEFVARVSSHQRGSSYPAVTDRAVLEEVIVLPPLAEQRAIAEILGTVKRAKEATEKVITTGRKLKRSVIRRLFTYGPVPSGQAGNVDLRDTDFGPVPRHWEIRPLGECALIQSGVTKGRRLDKSTTIEVPYLRVANVQDGFLDLKNVKTIAIKEDELERYRLRVGDVLFTEGGDIDKLGRGHIWHGDVDTCVHQNHIFAVRPDLEQLSPEYLSYLVQSSYGKAYFLRVGHRTTHLASINRAKLAAFPVLIPPREEQKEIARLIAAVEHKIDVEVHRQDGFERLFDSLLSGLLTGLRRIEQPEVA